MRIWTISAASLATVGLAGCLAAQQIYTGRVSGHPVIWSLAGIWGLLWVAFLAAFVRDEVRVILEPLVRRIDNVEADVDEMADPHTDEEMPVPPTRTIRQRGLGRRLNPVE
ncbi:MAG: hypothetical protein HOV94_34505 [Saccharothrix sp.]|nr:hypothetical protein [Saccharothrix sp.]